MVERRRKQVADIHPENINPERCVLLVGDPVDGITLYGPFDNSEDAGDYAEQFHGNDTWWIVTPTPVQCDDNGNWIALEGRT